MDIDLGAGALSLSALAPTSKEGTMPSVLGNLRRTAALKHVMVARLVAGLPLGVLGVMHLTGVAPLRPILEAANTPFAGLNAVAAPVVEVVAALLLLSGALARVGAVLGASTMAAALYAHVAADWPDEPPIVLPLAVLASCLYVLWRGAGAWSVDHRARG